MKNSIHFFGDSYTEGHALKKTPYIWPRLVCKALGDYNYNNYAEGAASPSFILNQLIVNLKSIKKNDIVIVVETIPDRTEVYSSKLNRVVSITNGAMVQALEDKEHEYFDNFNDIKSAFNFIYDHRYKRIRNFEQYYRNLYNAIGSYIENLGVKFILIPFHYTFDNIEYGDRFETVTKYTKGKVVDAHFSTKGHWQFANYVLESYFKDYQELKEPTEKLLI